METKSEKIFELKKIMKIGESTLGVILPKKFLHSLSLKHKSTIKIELEDNKIILEKFDLGNF
jgi:antitoxin component of MazEF toxin-antitoxin module